MNSIGLKCLECRSLDAIALLNNLSPIDKRSSRLSVSDS
jgi:hypothetical protein